jgi:hypothetical protein
MFCGYFLELNVTLLRGVQSVCCDNRKNQPKEKTCGCTEIRTLHKVSVPYNSFREPTPPADFGTNYRLGFLPK